MNWMNDDSDDNDGTTMISLLHRRLFDSGLALCKFWGWQWCDCCISDGLGRYDEDLIVASAASQQWRSTPNGDERRWYDNDDVIVASADHPSLSSLHWHSAGTTTMMIRRQWRWCQHQHRCQRRCQYRRYGWCRWCRCQRRHRCQCWCRCRRPMQPMPMPMTRTGWGEREVNWMLQPAKVRWIYKTKDASQNQYSRW